MEQNSSDSAPPNAARTRRRAPFTHLPGQNLLLAASTITVASAVALAINSRVGFPLGGWVLVEQTHLQWRGFPAWLPLAWAAALLSARGTARLLLLSKRQSLDYGYWLLGVTALLATLAQAALDLFASRAMHWWYWTSTGWTWEGIALPNLAGCLVVNAVALLFATPALIDKRPVQSLPSPLPLAVWFAFNIVCLTGCLSRTSNAAVALIAAPTLIVSTLAFQRYRSAVGHCGGPADQG